MIPQDLTTKLRLFRLEDFKANHLVVASLDLKGDVFER